MMPHLPHVDITQLAVLGDQFPLRLLQLGYRLMQVYDESGNDQYQYVLPPVCTVPAGHFLMGSDPQQDFTAQADEFPQQEVLLPTFTIGTYPVTVAEYACAVQAGAIEAPYEEGFLAWQEQQSRIDHPVVNISWLSAQDYAAWLSTVTGQIWRLPTEAEWEKAARSTDGRLYPWGDEAQLTESDQNGPGLQPTNAIGMTPHLASPYQVQDLVGNVCQWCNSSYRPYPYRVNDGREDRQDWTQGRVTRGCPFGVISVYARVACREKSGPDSYGRDTGTRLVQGAGVGLAHVPSMQLRDWLDSRSL